MIELKSLKYHLKRSVRVPTALGMVFLFLWKSHQVENPSKSDPERPKPCPAKISTSARNCCPEGETLKHDFGADRHSDAFLIPFEVIWSCIGHLSSPGSKHDRRFSPECHRNKLKLCELEIHVQMSWTLKKQPKVIRMSYNFFWSFQNVSRPLSFHENMFGLLSSPGERLKAPGWF